MFNLKFAAIAATLLFSSVQCGQKKAAHNEGVPEHTEVVPTQAPTETANPSKQDEVLLKKIDEEVPENPVLIKLKKDFWLGKKIWVSLGVERSSVTGLAMSVMGYLPAQLEREGMQLVVKRQNKGLYGGSTLAPELPLNSYPILSETEKEILVDLSQPLAAYGMTALGMVMAKDSSSEIQARLAYVKNIALQENKLSFDTVLTGKSPIALFEEGDGSVESITGQDPFLLSLTLRQDWILEEPDPQFKIIPSSGVRQGFFLENPFVESHADGLRLKQFVSHIDFTKPFQWTISHNTPDLYKKAVTEGILSWNKTMANEFLKVNIGAEGDAFTDPSRSNMVWDDNLAIGMAFANWRSNPYTGQILQAQVYMSGKMWAENGKEVYRLRRIEEAVRSLYTKTLPTIRKVPTGKTVDKEDDLRPSPGPILLANIYDIEKEIQSLKKEIKKQVSESFQKQKVRRFTIGFNGANAAEAALTHQYCLKTTEHLEGMISTLSDIEKGLANFAKGPESDEWNQVSGLSFVSSLPEEFHNPYPANTLTEQQFAENVVRAVVMHEVGHTLGLRHNFIASTQTSDSGRIQSGSIMDYNDLVIDAQFDQPGDADTWILSQVYPVKNRDKVRPMRFCTDPDVREKKLNCTMHDFGPSTLDSYAAQTESGLLMAHFLMSVGDPSAFSQLRRAIRSSAPMIRDMLTSTNAGTALFGADFEQQQERSWKFLQDFKNQMSLFYIGLPETLFRDAGFALTVSQINPNAAFSVVFPKVLEEFKQVLLDESNDRNISARHASLLGLHKIQHADARATILSAQAILLARTNKSVEDEELLLHMGKLLSNGYYLIEEE